MSFNALPDNLNVVHSSIGTAPNDWARQSVLSSRSY